jgi:DNA-binding NarL/FixJ family response regulator
VPQQTSDQAPRRAARAGKQQGLFSSGEWERLFDVLCVSRRESQILLGLFENLNESSIAARLGISAHTVRTHVERLYRKLQVNNRIGLLLKVFQAYLHQHESRGGQGNAPLGHGVHGTGLQAS